MLPRRARLRLSDDFRRTTRAGARAARPTLVVHAVTVPDTAVRVGFVVSKAVGPAVTRNRVKRRLRHLAAAQLASTPSGTHLVVRALPRAGAVAADLALDFAKAWPKALQRLQAHR